MKKITALLTIALLSIEGIMAQNVLPKLDYNYDFYGVMQQMATHFGLRDEMNVKVQRNPESGALVSSMYILPFKIYLGYDGEDTMIPRLTEAFNQDKGKAYNCGSLRAGHSMEQCGTYAGNDRNSYVLIRDVGGQDNLLYLEMKNPFDPQMRDFFAVKWAEYKGENRQILGTMYYILSKRPDILLAEAQSNLPSNQVRVELAEALKMYDKRIQEVNETRKRCNGTSIGEWEAVYRDLKKKRQEILDALHKTFLEAFSSQEDTKSE